MTSQGGRTGPIEFYLRKDPYFEFTNFSWHGIEHQGEFWATSEHFFQSQKYTGNSPTPEHVATVRALKSPSDALMFARKHQKDNRTDWFDVNIRVMEHALYLKFTQHEDLRLLLLGTGDTELVENSPKDSFWGVGPYGTGRNELGKALMRLRERLAKESSEAAATA